MYFGFLLFKGLVWLIAWLPYRIIYCLSDILYLILFHVARYRKKVVFTNLRNSFPEKDEREIRHIAKKYYHNLADIILEIVKLRHINAEKLNKRVSFTNPEVLYKLYSEGRKIIAVLGHCGNWEMGMMHLALSSPIKSMVVVKPLTNKYFDQYFDFIRTRLVEKNLIKFKDTYRTLLRNKNIPFICGFATDQTPTRGEIRYWTIFMNQDTPVFLGPEKIAKTLDCAVVFLDIHRRKRGVYEITIEEIVDNPKATTEFEITEKHVKMLEQVIRKYPDNWLWSHKRWKHKKVV